ncbi:hypothetical protein HOT38_gp33 [Escherichia phage vB_EcoP_S523]|uniref:Uncharacterized protein n=6 Tax=Berlinvirus TaxID=2732677 RepID=A0A7G3WWP3_9CAUD|nr:unknown product [Escherichia phage BA14]YP_004300556.1 hypothetical protein LXB_022 [Escherichia phage 285P]YP_008766736.1 hypothetical protein V419_gp22 [Erwinia phage FE44]YP_009802490.1 hypothetical protein HOT38_gp33 [Escherichia phage vB_EcoP_S523]QLF85771.1 hypothetical protein [Escherichia phage PhiV-1]QMV34464.1 hypothetical protein PZJ0206_29 [Enterobacter phage PZJ0206]WPJ67495.1 hypothetical protein car1b_024 [Escherichia phage Carena]DAO40101.1 MAG TPA: hypothetical protein [C
MVTITLVLTLITVSGQTISQVPITAPKAEAYEICEQQGRSWSKDLMKNGRVFTANYNCI